MPCRCLLRQVDKDNELRSIRELIDLMPPEEKADESEYEKRLAACLDCPDLHDGLCGQCGCYVELRAAKRRMYCPLPRPKWSCSEEQPK